MTKLEAYIMRFIAFYRKVKEYYVRVIEPWVVLVILFGLAGINLYAEYVLRIPYFGDGVSIFFILCGIVLLFLKFTGNLK